MLVQEGSVVDRFVRAVYRRVTPSAIHPHIEVLDAASQIFPHIYEHHITLGRLAWRWGHLTNDNLLIFLCLLAASGHSPIVEFGTFTGRTAYNLALQLPRDGKITTIDIGPQPSSQESARYHEYVPGEVFLDATEPTRGKIEAVVSDSTTLDLSPLYGRIGLAIVDGGHSYEVCKSDSETALRLVRSGGVIVWDDYGSYWPGVKRAVDELSHTARLRYLRREGVVVYVSG